MKKYYQCHTMKKILTCLLTKEIYSMYMLNLYNVKQNVRLFDYAHTPSGYLIHYMLVHVFGYGCLFTYL